MSVKRNGICISILLITTACSTPGKTVGLSAGVGGAAGATAGALADGGPGGENRIRNVLIGTAIGGGIGAASGYFIQKKMTSDREASEVQGRKEVESQQTKDSGELPKLIPPQTEARWVADAVRSNVFTPGHFEYIIVSPARWEGGR